MQIINRHNWKRNQFWKITFKNPHNTVQTDQGEMEHLREKSELRKIRLVACVVSNICCRERNGGKGKNRREILRVEDIIFYIEWTRQRENLVSEDLPTPRRISINVQSSECKARGRRAYPKGTAVQQASHWGLCLPEVSSGGKLPHCRSGGRSPRKHLRRAST